MFSLHRAQVFLLNHYCHLRYKCSDLIAGVFRPAGGPMQDLAYLSLLAVLLAASAGMIKVCARL